MARCGRRRAAEASAARLSSDRTFKRARKRERSDVLEGGIVDGGAAKVCLVAIGWGKPCGRSRGHGTGMIAPVSSSCFLKNDDE